MGMRVSHANLHMHAYTAGETRKRDTQEWQLDPKTVPLMA